ncbi:P-loop containing nucleoside triphosphate hydrolase protein [Paraphoma chrysanthemicola]|uniref:P-loop containing nucleoside triphosphate hydrolase protein n=1 Tax=Paraphoma chrysanthemicola TaxID=798071 RepID=A0A8K0RFU5_9PLEO|nr:P-loop containing nucleoside triphosphate hydrolase protein [Paraphoma chrysanthemicola]
MRQPSASGSASGSGHDGLGVPETPVLRPDDVVIAVMGITGSGKTTFINHLSDYPLSIGHDLNSCTQDVQIVPCTFQGGEKIYLVDTPGFDDDLRTDSEILMEVARWLNHAYENKLRLSGIIYLQRITDNRIGGSGVRNLKMFKKLCGDDGLASVVLATTFWNFFPDPTKANEREAQFQREAFLWKPLIEKGSRVFRHDKQEASALAIVRYLIKRKKPVVLDIQREMVEQNLPLGQTGAGGVVASGIEKEKEWFEKRLKDLEIQLHEALAKRDKSQREDIEDMMAEYRRKLDIREEDQRRLEADTKQLYKDMEKRYEEEMKEMNKAIREKELTIQETRMQVTMMQETHAHQLELRELQAQMKWKEKYYRMMHSSACIVM